MSNDSNRRRFMQLTAGGLVVSAALTSPDTTCAGSGSVTASVNPITGDVLRTSGQLSSDAKSMIESERPIPVVGTSDILICGAGPAGIAAALSAARAGASVQLIEVAGCLGGVWTVGLLTKILDAGNKQGIMKELLRKFTEHGSQVAMDSQGTVYDPEVAKLVLEEVCVEAGMKIRLHTRLVGAVLNKQKQLVAVLTESKSGREAWLAERFIDCSGDGDLAAHAGCEFEVGTGSDCTCQPMSMLALLTGLDPELVRPWIRETGSVAKKRLLELMEIHGINPSYRAPTLRHLHSNIFSLMTNHEYGVSAFDANAITAATLRARKEIHEIVDGLRSIGGPWKDLAVVATAEQIGVREGRRVRGRYTVTASDLAHGLNHPQGVCRATFPIDVHALNSAGNKEINRDFKTSGMKPYDIPYLALVAADVDGLLMAGRCISGDFIAHSSYRVTGNAVPMGEAAGLAAALSIKQRVMPHELEWKKSNS
ncbi:MAG TPA: FAD-dependent oxidoreductase [Rhodopirellula sp.]|nr:FAD-dependent oxidoreductase [Rhodopirellula sp.]